MAECAGNVLGHNVAYVVGDTSFLFALVMLLVLVAVGFAFGDGLFVIDLDDEDEEDLASLSAAINPAAGNYAGRQDTAQQSPIPGRQTGSHAAGSGSSAILKGGPAVTRQTDSPIGAQQAPNRDGARELEAPEPASTKDAIADFVSRYGLSERETDVFALWVTGHGLKYIQNTLFISESTVKTHLRNIYRKCDTHNRAEIIALFEGKR